MANYALAPEPCTQRHIVAGDPAQRAIDRLLIGRSVESGPSRELWLDVTGEQVVAAFGKRGTGKSYTLGVLLEGLAAGKGSTAIAQLSTSRGGLVLDIMDIYWTSAIPLTADGPPEVRKQYGKMAQRGLSSQPLNLDVWIPSGFRNEAIDPEGVKALTIAPSELSIDDWAVLFGVDVYGEPRGMLVADLIQHVSVTGYTTEQGLNIPAERNFGLQQLLTCLDTDETLARDYQDQTRRSIRQRLTTYSSLALFSAPGTALTELIQPFRVAILMLGRLPDALKSVTVAVLIRRILTNRRDVSFASKRLDLDPKLSDDERLSLTDFVSHGLPRTWVLMDEAHVLAGNDSSSVAADALVKYAKEGRNYGLSLAVATQQPSALDGRLVSQVETLICHQLTSPADAGIAARALRSPAPTSITVDGAHTDLEGLLRRLGQGEAVFSSGNAPNLMRSFVVGVRPRITAHGGYEA